MNNKKVYALVLYAKNIYSDFNHLYDFILKQCQVCYNHVTQSVIHTAQHADLKKRRRITSQDVIRIKELQYSTISLIQYPQDEISAGSFNSVYINLSSFR